MKNKIKSILKYALAFIIIVATLIILMIVTLITIPRKNIEANLTQSAKVLESKSETRKIYSERYYSYLHVYADEILLNILYCMDENDSAKSIMEAKYYKDKLQPNLSKAIELESKGNTEYMRYWHGSIAILRPLLIFFNIQQIYYIFAIILAILLLLLIIILLKKKNHILIIAMALGLIATASWYVPFCIEYTWTYLLMFVATIIAVLVEKKEKGNTYINMLMFLTGIITCFLDFLTTETITFLVPILFILAIRYKEKRIISLKETIKQIILWMFLWFIGYVFMWGAKWLLASIILNLNAMDYVTEKAMVRINATNNEPTITQTIIKSLNKNFSSLFTTYIFNEPIIVWSIIIACFVGVVLISKKDKKDILMALTVFVIGLIPYIRYIVLSSHSRGHYFFTFRAQIVSIIAIIIVIYILIDKEKLNKNISIKRKENGKK